MAPRPLSQQECVTAIREHSEAFARDATGNLDADVEFCPGWTVRDVVHHLTGVQWFWATLVEQGIATRPDDLERPDPAPDDVALDVFRRGADRLAGVLADADPATPVWTWAASHQTAWFVIRHQVQEAAGHHWDVAHAAGRGVVVEPRVGADCVDEFLHVSVSNQDDAAGGESLPDPLDGRIGFACTDSDAAWLVTDGDPAGTAAVTRTSPAALHEDAVPTVVGTGGQLLLWLYDRHGDPAGDADDSAVDPALRQRFRGLCFTT